MKKRYLLKQDINQELLKVKASAFSVKDFANLFGVSVRRGSLYLSRNTGTKGSFTRLIRGYYYPKSNPPSVFEISNTLLKPSYISLESALSYHKLIPEVVYSVTAVTTKQPRVLTALNQEYKYHHVMRGMYFGYKTINVGQKRALIATKEKALLDFLYFVALGEKRISDRADLRSIDWKIFETYLKQLRRNVKNKYIVIKLDKIISNIK